MIDYLEEMLEDPDGLLERTRELEQALARRAESGGPSRPPEEGGDPAEDRAPLPAGPAPGGRNGQDMAGEARGPLRPASEEGAGQRLRRETGLEEPGNGGYPVLAELERLERAAASVLNGAAPGGRNRGAAWQDGGAWETAGPGELVPSGRGRGRGVSAGSGPRGEPPWLGRGRWPLAVLGTQDWAEQADRAFCRDSRRYDGGFYLY